MRTVTMMLLGAGVMIATTLMLLGTPRETLEMIILSL